MPNIVLSILGRDQSGPATKSAESNLAGLRAKQEEASRAVSAAARREEDATGRVRVAEAALAEARAKYAADSVQVVRAEERMAASQRALTSAHETAESASARVAAAARRVAVAEDETASAAESASRRMRSSWDGVGAAVSSMAERSRSGLSTVVGRLADVATGLAKQAVGVAAGFAVYNVGADALSDAYNVAKTAVFDFNSQLENATIGFTTMLGSGKKAQVFLDQLQAFAQKTPFEFSSLVTNAQQMMGMGIAAKNVIPDLTALGDSVAAMGGSADQVNQVVLAFDQMNAKGTLDMGNIEQLAQGGVPSAMKILAASYHTTTGEMIKMISSGKVLSSDALPRLVKGIEEGTSKTAALGGMMSKQSNTFTGALSNISDGLNQSLAKGFRPFFKVVEVGAEQVAKFVGSKGFQNWASDTSKSIGKLIGFVKPLFEDLTGGENGKAAQRLLKTLKERLDDIGPAVRKILPHLEHFAKEVLPSLTEATRKLIDKLPTVLKNWERVARALDKAGPTIAKLVGILGGLTGAFFDTSNAIGNFAGDAVKNFLSFYHNGRKVLKDFIDWAPTAGADIITGLVNGLTGVDISGIMRNIAEGAKEAFKVALGIASPSKVFHQFGVWMMQGLANGMRSGSADDVNSALSDLVSRVKAGYSDLSDEVKKARSDQATAQGRLTADRTAAQRLGRERDAAEQRLADAKTAEARKSANDRLADLDAQAATLHRKQRKDQDDWDAAQDTLTADRSVAARKAEEARTLAVTRAGQAQLAALAKTRDQLTSQLSTAKDALSSATDVRDSYRSDVATSVTGLGSVTASYSAARQAGGKTDPVKAIQANLSSQIKSANSFRSELGKLRKEGLDATSYKQLVDDYASGNGGTEAFDLVQAGPGAVRAIASLQKRLATAASGLGYSTSKSLYQSGVDAAQGLVDGLDSKIDEVSSSMAKVADAMVKRIRKDLGIKSPSTVFRDHGVYVTQGLVQGLLSGRSDVADAVGSLMPAGVRQPGSAAAARTFTMPGAAAAGGRGPLVHIDNFHATPTQSPADIASDLAWIARGAGF